MSTVSWPTMSDYQEAIQNPRLCFNDPELQRGTPATDILGLPRPITGAFASVYQISTGAKKYAVRCFLRYHPDQERRYAAISAALHQLKLPCMVEFTWQNQGIRVRGKWYPILKMEWLNGQTLDTYISQHLDSATLKNLATKFATVIADLKNAGIAHGDLQHGNILVVNNELRLIDYDGMYVPSLQGLTSHEVGHRNYQHPRRTERDFGPHMDNFSAWVIYTSLVVLSVKPSLWRELKGGDENLLFRKEDFDKPTASPVIRAISQLTDSDVQTTVNAFQALFKSDMLAVPSLDGERIAFTPPTRPISGGSSWLSDYVQPQSPAPTNLRATRPAILPEDTGAIAVAPKTDASWIRDHLPAKSAGLNPPPPARTSTGLPSPASNIPTPVHLPVAAITGVELSTDAQLEHRILDMYLGLMFLFGVAGAIGLIGPTLIVAAALLGAGSLGGFLAAQYGNLPEVLDKRQVRDEIRDLRRQMDTTAQDLRAIQADLRRLDDNEQFDVLQIRQQTVASFIVDQLRYQRLEDADIPRVGEGLRSKLLAAGIATAADVDRGRLFSVEGIGEARANRLLEWRQSLENQIRARMPNGFDAIKIAQERKVLAQYQSKRDQLKTLEKAAQKQLTQFQKGLEREEQELEIYEAVNGFEYVRRVLSR